MPRQLSSLRRVLISTSAFTLASTFLGAATRLGAATLLCCATGCIYAGGRTVREMGPQLSEGAVSAVQPGVTTAEWLIATFGEPSERVCTSEGCEIMRYDCEVRTTEGSYLFMLFASSSNTITRTCWWFELLEGKVVRVWGEKCGEVCVNAATPPTTAPPQGERFDAGTMPSAQLHSSDSVKTP